MQFRRQRAASPAAGDGPPDRADVLQLWPTSRAERCSERSLPPLTDKVAKTLRETHSGVLQLTGWMRVSGASSDAAASVTVQAADTALFTLHTDLLIGSFSACPLACPAAFARRRRAGRLHVLAVDLPVGQAGAPAAVPAEDAQVAVALAAAWVVVQGGARGRGAASSHAGEAVVRDAAAVDDAAAPAEAGDPSAAAGHTRAAGGSSRPSSCRSRRR